MQGNLEPSAKLPVGGDPESAIDMSFGQNNSVIKTTGLTELEKQANAQTFRVSVKRCCAGYIGVTDSCGMQPLLAPAAPLGGIIHENFK